MYHMRQIKSQYPSIARSRKMKKDCSLGYILINTICIEKKRS